MVTKTALILLFLAMPVVGQEIVATYAIGLLPKHDTTRYYIKEIKQKCDTIHKWSYPGCRKCQVTCSALICTPQIQCVDDTIWAAKVQVWLTPEQIKAMAAIIQERIETWEWKKRWLDIIRNGEAPTKELKE